MAPLGGGVVGRAHARPPGGRWLRSPRVVELTREQEFAYIRSDMRRLFLIAGGLLAIMLVLLVVVSR